MYIAEKQYQNRQEFLTDLDLILQNSIIFNSPESVFSKKAQHLINVANEFFDQFGEQLSVLENNIKSGSYDEFGGAGFDDLDQSQDAEGYESDDDDEDMEVVEPEPTAVRSFSISICIAHYKF